MIEWFARNDVAANLLLIFLVALGLNSAFRVLPLEVMPTVTAELVSINTVQRGATPADIESGITTRIEEAIADYVDIDEIQSTSSEGNSSIRATLIGGSDKQKALNEIKSRVDALSTLPGSAERPTISSPERTSEVMTVVVYGDVDEKELNLLGRQVEDEILRVPGISQTSIEGIRPFEISINISEQSLREYGLNIADISNAIRAQSIDLSAGQVRSKSGDILLSTRSQAYNFDDYANITIRNFADGSRLKLSDIADIDDGFDENAVLTRYNGKRAVRIRIDRTGNESAIEVAKKVYAYIDQAKDDMPESVKLGVWDDDAVRVENRLLTLGKSAWQGALLVFILLALMLRTKVAIWVVVGIPVCFAGALALMPLVGVTINSMSVFGFIIVLGVVVDDAIVTGENIYTHFTRHGDGLRAAIEGTEEVTKPVVFGVLTTIAAFFPMALYTEGHGAFAAAMATVVICCLIFSLVESKLILPAHLKHLKNAEQRSGSSNIVVEKFRQFQDRISSGMMSFAHNVYKPFLVKVVRHRYLTLTIFTCLTVLATTMFSTGMVGFSFFPRLPSETATVTLTMAEGTPYEVTAKALEKIESAAIAEAENYVNSETGESSIFGIMSTVGSQGGGGRNSRGAGNRARVQVEMDISDSAPVPLNGFKFINDWRERAGPIMGVESLTYRAERFRFSDPVNVRITSNDDETLRNIIPVVEEKLASYNGVFDISNTLNNGKRELRIDLKPEGELLGLSLQDVGSQVRSAFFGTEAQRIQRERDDIRVMVKYPLNERSDLSELDDLLIKTGNNSEARFGDIATVEWSRSASSIARVDQRRAISVTADVDKSIVDETALANELDAFLAETFAPYKSLAYSLEGQQADQRESNQDNLFSMMFILIVVYTLLAIPFRSYSQPFIVIAVIPFSLVGVIIGHTILGINMSVLSIWGVLALLGILVNDSLVMVDWINRKLDEGTDKFEAIVESGAARFRPIILTSVTTFAGVFPIMFDSTPQGQFLVPMATSLGFGVLFGTVITLLMVPCNYMILQDIRRLLNKDIEPTKEDYVPLSNELRSEI